LPNGLSSTFFKKNKNNSIWNYFSPNHNWFKYHALAADAVLTSSDQCAKQPSKPSPLEPFHWQGSF
jgi:hypothetical protein